MLCARVYVTGGQRRGRGAVALSKLMEQPSVLLMIISRRMDEAETLPETRNQD